MTAENQPVVQEPASEPPLPTGDPEATGQFATISGSTGDGDGAAAPDTGAIPAVAADGGQAKAAARKRRRRGIRLKVLFGIVICLVLALVAGSGVGLWAFNKALHASYPQVSGTLQISGLSAPVGVQRDANGIPQIYADTPSDLFLAEGYVEAQDRFWQMDVDRHATSGTLSAMFGKASLSTDEFVRTLGWEQVAEKSYAELKPSTQQYLQAFSQGVNDYLAAHPGGSSLSIEYDIIGVPLVGTVHDYRPAPWTPIDSVAWIEAMAWDLRENVDDEVSRSLLTQTMTVDQIDQLYPPYPFAQHSPIVTQGALVGSTYETDPKPAKTPTSQNTVPTLPPGAQTELTQLSGLLSQLPSQFGPQNPGDAGVGSNSWVVSGKLTDTGKPLLANDPHLSPSLPSIWYQIGLHCNTVSTACPYDVAGYTFPGMPGVVIGHNDSVAWGFTNESDDVSDLYLEKIDGNDYLYDGREYPLTEHTETIDVAGGSPVTITVRATDHGPLISDLSSDPQYKLVGTQAPAARAGDPAEGAAPGIQYGVALEWTALQPSNTMDALFELDRATDWTQFRAAAKDFTVPAQNLIYADTKGNIGYQAPGKIPIRKSGDGEWPVPGWTDQYDWTGYIPFSALPNEYDPKQGYIVTANNAVIGPQYPYLLTNDWDYGYRSQEIADDIKKDTAGGGKITEADMASIQMDTYNPEAALLVPYLLGVRVDSYTKPAQDLLKNWNFEQPADSAAAAYYNAVWTEILQMAFASKMPTDVSLSTLGFDGGDRWFAVVQSIIKDPNSPWWSSPKQVTTPGAATKLNPAAAEPKNRDELLTDAMEQARIDMTALEGKNISTWSWGRVHTLTPTEQSLGTSGPGIVKWLLNGSAEPLAGGTSIVDATSWDPSTGNYTVDVAPSMRMIVDLADLDQSRWVNQTGESGHVGDPHYLDQAPLWAAGRTLPWAFSPAAVRAATVDTLTLDPPGTAGPSPATSTAQ
jgi:penicillin G amidase